MDAARLPNHWAERADGAGEDENHWFRESNFIVCEVIEALSEAVNGFLHNLKPLLVVIPGEIQ